MVKSVNFSVGMTCAGCSSKIARALKFVDGVIEIKADVETKHVEVICEDSVDPKDLLDVLLNWSSSSGKPVELLA